MSVAKVIELTSSSEKSIEDAVQQGVKRADDTINDIEGVWVQDVKGIVKGGKVVEWRTNLKVTFVLKE
ncbi:MAG: dodecin domain-containing protein [Rhizobiales bacterium]|nr:dodecin domain-containing protein [Hyphomicrobiales bacterium]